MAPVLRGVAFLVAVVLVLAPLVLALGGQHAGHAERQVLDPDDLTHGVGIGEERLGHRRPQEGHRLSVDQDGLAGIQQLAGDATLLYYMSEEAQEGRDAYLEKRPPDFSRFPRRP